MLKLKMLVSMAGPEYSLSVGDTRDFGDAEAGRLIAAGYAVIAEEESAETDKPVRGRKKAD